MKVSDIRPDDLVEENLKLHRADVWKMMDRVKEFVDVPCPACRSPHWRVAFNKDGFEHRRCADCDTLYICPRPTQDVLMDWYSNADSARHWNRKLFPATEASRRESIFKPRARLTVDICREFGVRSGSLLDAGAGFGTFLEELRALNAFERLTAVEPSTELVKTLLDKGLNAIQMPIECLDIRGLDVITAWELVEHLYRPQDFVEVCSRSLHPGGLLILTTPNVKGFDLMLLGERAIDTGGPNHLNRFNAYSITVLLESAGFSVVSLTTPGKLDVDNARKAVLDGRLDVSMRPFLEQVLVRRWETVGEDFQKFLSDHNLSSHMMVVAKLLYNP